MNSSLWSGLDRLPGLSATLPLFLAALGKGYPDFRSFLRPTARRALSVVCPIQCRQGCCRRVVEHAGGRLTGVCPEGRRRVDIPCRDAAVHEIDIRKLCAAIATAVGVEPSHEALPDRPMLWRVGVFAAPAADRMPVYLALYSEPADFHEVAAELLVENPSPIILLGLTRRICPQKTETLLRQKASHFIPLEELVGIGPDHALVALATLHALLRKPPHEAREHRPGDAIIERFECEDGIHWAVDDIDKGVFFKRSESIKRKIIEILFEQIGHGWIPHETFMHACGWSRKRYFGTSGEPNLIQKHLTEIRNFLGVDVIFRKELGVRFAENVVKSGE